MKLTNTRPTAGKKTPTLEQRKKLSTIGAQWSPTMEQWLPWVFDGISTVNLEPKTTREKALEAARNYHHNTFYPELAQKVWKPPV